MLKILFIGLSHFFFHFSFAANNDFILFYDGNLNNIELRDTDLKIIKSFPFSRAILVRLIKFPIKQGRDLGTECSYLKKYIPSIIKCEKDLPIYHRALLRSDCDQNDNLNNINEVAKYFDKITNNNGCDLISNVTSTLKGRSLTKSWGDEFVGADLAKKFVNSIKSDLIDVAVFDSGFNESNYKNDVNHNHGALIANSIDGKNQFGGTDKIKILRKNNFLRASDFLTVNGLYSIDQSYPHLINVAINYGMESAKNTLDNFKKHGSIIIGAAGNDYPRSPFVDSEEENLGQIIVGSMRPTGFPSYFSQEGAISILAPGNFEVYGRFSIDNPKLAQFGGTSAASAFVTSSLTNIKSLIPELDVEQIKNLLKFTAIPVANSLDKKNNNGPGLLNSFKMAKVAQQIKLQCKSDIKCMNNLIHNSGSSIYQFKRDPTLGENIKKTFPACSPIKTKNLSMNVSCEDKKRVFEKLREESFLHDDNELWSVVACIYKKWGLNENAKFYELLAGRPKSYLEDIKRRIESHDPDKYNSAIEDAIKINDSKSFLQSIDLGKGDNYFKSLPLFKINEMGLDENKLIQMVKNGTINNFDLIDLGKGLGLYDSRIVDFAKRELNKNDENSQIRAIEYLLRVTDKQASKMALLKSIKTKSSNLQLMMLRGMSNPEYKFSFKQFDDICGDYLNSMDSRIRLEALSCIFHKAEFATPPEEGIVRTKQIFDNAIINKDEEGIDEIASFLKLRQQYNYRSRPQDSNLISKTTTDDAVKMIEAFPKSERILYDGLDLMIPYCPSEKTDCETMIDRRVLAYVNRGLQSTDGNIRRLALLGSVLEKESLNDRLDKAIMDSEMARTALDIAFRSKPPYLPAIHKALEMGIELPFKWEIEIWNPDLLKKDVQIKAYYKKMNDKHLKYLKTIEMRVTDSP